MRRLCHGKPSLCFLVIRALAWLACGRRKAEGTFAIFAMVAAGLSPVIHALNQPGYRTKACFGIRSSNAVGTSRMHRVSLMRLRAESQKLVAEELLHI